jgi:hypothetical protein
MPLSGIRRELRATWETRWRSRSAFVATGHLGPCRRGPARRGRPRSRRPQGRDTRPHTRAPPQRLRRATPSRPERPTKGIRGGPPATPAPGPCACSAPGSSRADRGSSLSPPVSRRMTKRVDVATVGLHEQGGHDPVALGPTACGGLLCGGAGLRPHPGGARVFVRSREHRVASLTRGSSKSAPGRLTGPKRCPEVCSRWGWSSSRPSWDVRRSRR